MSAWQLAWPWLAYGACVFAWGYWLGRRRGQIVATKAIVGRIDRLLRSMQDAEAQSGGRALAVGESARLGGDRGDREHVLR